MTLVMEDLALPPLFQFQILLLRALVTVARELLEENFDQGDL